MGGRQSRRSAADDGDLLPGALLDRRNMGILALEIPIARVPGKLANGQAFIVLRAAATGLAGRVAMSLQHGGNRQIETHRRDRVLHLVIHDLPDHLDREPLQPLRLLEIAPLKGVDDTPVVRCGEVVSAAYSPVCAPGETAQQHLIGAEEQIIASTLHLGAGLELEHRKIAVLDAHEIRQRLGASLEKPHHIHLDARLSGDVIVVKRQLGCGGCNLCQTAN